MAGLVWLVVALRPGFLLCSCNDKLPEKVFRLSGRGFSLQSPDVFWACTAVCAPGADTGEWLLMYNPFPVQETALSLCKLSSGLFRIVVYFQHTLISNQIWNCTQVPVAALRWKCRFHNFLPIWKTVETKVFSGEYPGELSTKANALSRTMCHLENTHRHKLFCLQDWARGICFAKQA